MSQVPLTADEKRCLQMWFRQAIVKLETEEACKSLQRWHAGDNNAPKNHHHSPVGMRRGRRTGHSSHSKELV